MIREHILYYRRCKAQARYNKWLPKALAARVRNENNLRSYTELSK